VPRIALVSALLALLAHAACPPPAPARAEKVDLDAAGLRATATHVVLAEVKAVYERTQREGDYRVTRRVAELKVEQVEKGEGLDASAPLYVRYWTQTWAGAGAMPPGAGGHRGLPKEGERLRIYLARNAYDGFSTTNHDGGFNVIGANGFERLPAPRR
jgi:hypothetical protein